MTESRSVPALRLRTLVDRPPAGERSFVLYWMTSARRLDANFALERALELAVGAGRPLVVLEALRCGYRWASDRHHAFVLQGMAANARRAAALPILYYPYVEPDAGAGRGLVAELSRHAVAIVADDAPVFFLPKALAAAARQADCRLEAVDSNGLLPLAATERAYPTAYAFRRHLQATLKRHLRHPPSFDPFAGAVLPRIARLPAPIETRWPRASEALLAAASGALAALPIDHTVGVVGLLPGGAEAAERRLSGFVGQRLPLYAEERNDPDADGASGLSPYLHFGHLSSHQVLAAIAAAERWSAETLPERGNGGRAGWWGMSPAAEAFLDQLVTWRELGLVSCHHQPGSYDDFGALPEWARATLHRHRTDERPWLYSLSELDAAATHDPIWNAAQRQLVREGRIQNYLRMLWGKKILEWSVTPEAAFEAMYALNDRYALDGRDPNSASGISWCLGRYDRPWGPERPIFGTVRYMSSDNTRRKLRLGGYLEQWSEQGDLFRAR